MGYSGLVSWSLFNFPVYPRMDMWNEYSWARHRLHAYILINNNDNIFYICIIIAIYVIYISSTFGPRYEQWAVARSIITMPNILVRAERFYSEMCVYKPFIMYRRRHRSARVYRLGRFFLNSSQRRRIRPYIILPLLFAYYYYVKFYYYYCIFVLLYIYVIL